MAKSKGLSKRELASLCRDEIDNAIGYDKKDLRKKRRRALEYYRGEMSDISAQPKRSKVTTHDIADTIGWLMPQVMRAFTGSDIIAEYEPSGPEDEQFAKQATDYINYKFIKDCDGYRVLYTAFHEGFLFGNGVVKHWWDTTPKYCSETYRNLTPEQYIAIAEDENVKVMEHTEKPQEGVLDPMGAPLVLHDLKIRRKESDGRLCVEGLPNEEFLIERDAKSITDANFVCHRQSKTRSDLIAMGFDRQKVMDLGEGRELQNEEQFQARHSNASTLHTSSSTDPMMEEVELFECYVRADYDGDDYAEWNQVFMAGSGSDKAILAHEEWDSEVPFTDMVPDPIPHRWDGRSIYDELVDVQRVKTVLIRQTLDNLYHTNNPMIEAVENQLTEEGEDTLYEPEFGAIVKTKAPRSINPLVVPFVAGQSFQMLEYVDQMGEKRTGAGTRTMGLDPDTMQNQTATAVQAQQSQQQGKQELYVRNLAETGVRRLFRCLLELFVKNQPRPEVIRLRNEWVEMDPRQWSAKMDATVTVGLGTGSKDRDLNMLNAVKMSQEQILMNMGPQNPLVSLEQYANTLTKLAETAGIKNPEMFFNRLTAQDVQAYQQAQQQQPNPEMQKAQAEMQMKAQEAQMNAQIREKELAQKVAMQRAEGEQRIQVERERMAAQLELDREKQAADIALANQKAVHDFQLRMAEINGEHQLTEKANARNAQMNANRAADTNLDRRTD